MEAFRRVLGVVPGRTDNDMNGFLLVLAVVASIGLPFFGAVLIKDGLDSIFTLQVLSSTRARVGVIIGVIILLGGVWCAGLIYAEASPSTLYGRTLLLLLKIAHLMVFYCVIFTFYDCRKEFVRQRDWNKIR